MLPPSPTHKGSLRAIFLLYISLLLGQVLFSLVILFLITQPDRVLKDGSDYPFLAALVVFLAGGAAWFINRLRSQQLPHLRANLEGILLHYRTTVVMRSAMVEAGNLFCLVLAFLEGSLAPIVFFCLGLGVFLLFRPRLDELFGLYPLNEGERRQLEQALKNRSL